ncbi:hypothetical protein [Rhizobium sp. PL01]|uniref:hypothetical protein n=1 Tax=Rhizobium sp. PL01 TaxID=3085631 RepID=UPI002980CDDA|nr:hypothetical protein [Rhizobium sp. PL01]MDW5318492.1 hypothetical protein [Rhizobium sp. PL01]
MTSLLKPVSSLHKKLMFDKTLSSVGKTCFLGQAKLAEFPVSVVTEGCALVTEEPQQIVPFVVREFPPFYHDHLPVELIDDSTLLLLEGVELLISASG